MHRCTHPFPVWAALNLLAAAALGQTIVIDNADPGFTIVSGSWSTGTTAPGHWGADYRFRNTTAGGTGPGEVEWRPVIAVPGVYEVATYYPQGTNRAIDAPFAIFHAGGTFAVDVNQQTNGGQWNVLGAFSFNAGTSGYVRLSNDAGPTVVIADAVRFTLQTSTVELTMAVQPAGLGTTDPPAGGPYTKSLNEVVPITATPAAGYEFDRWQVSAGSPPADPYSASTTVTMDQSKTVTAVFGEPGPQQPQFRAFWADAFHAGFKSVGEIDTMVAQAVAGNYNAIVPEILAFQDTGTGSGHGAYWNSGIVPRAADIVGGIDPLAEVVQRAHAAGLEVHVWLVAFRVCAQNQWPPAGNPTVGGHPEWLMVRQADMNQGPRPLSDGNSSTTDYYVLDPGSPGVQEYLSGIVREICTNYAVDGYHWDYIRYTQTDAGYPTDPNYTGSSLKRFQTIAGFSGTPPPTGNTAWNDFRRRTVTEVVRRAMFEGATAPNPRQPLRHSAALITWHPPNTNFTLTSPYTLFCDWRFWLEKGYLDAAIPMCYFDEAAYGATYRGWTTNSINWAHSYDRHVYIGPGIYLNTFADSATQINYALNAGADGICTYSYAVTNDGGQPNTNWYPYAASSIFAQPAPVPPMPWRDAATATDGTISGRVTDAGTGQPIDNAAIEVNGFTAAQADGNGRFILTRLAAAPSGTIIPISAVAPGFSEVVRPRAMVVRAGFTEINLGLGDWLPGDYDVDGDVDWSDLTRVFPALTGPNGPQTPTQPPPGSDLFDLEGDDDIDMLDFATLQASFGG